MARKVEFAFEFECIPIALDHILPTKSIKPEIKKSRKFLQIAASIPDVGIIEPPVVIKSQDEPKKYLLLDGHLRIEAAKDSGKEKVTCLIATEDEAYTYNKRINRLATIQEHKMILKAIESGVPEERIAKALAVNIRTIRQKRSLLDGICPEVVELLKDRDCPSFTFEMLKKMKPVRQIEVAEMMIAMNNFSRSYAKATVIGTPKDQLCKPEKTKNFKGVSAEQIAKMETEMVRLQQQMQLVGDSYGPDHLNLVLARGYVSSLLRNSNVLRYLEQHHGEILAEFRQVCEGISLGRQRVI